MTVFGESAAIATTWSYDTGVDDSLVPFKLTIQGTCQGISKVTAIHRVEFQAPLIQVLSNQGDLK